MSVAFRLCLGCGLLLISGDERLSDESFKGGWSGVAGSARFESAHVSGVQCRGSLRKEAGEIVGHSHLDRGGANLVVGEVDILQIRFSDGCADDRGDFGVVEIALAVKLLRLLAAEGELQESVGGRGTDVASGNHGKFEIGAKRSRGAIHGADRTGLQQSVFHKIYGAQVKDVRSIDPIQFLLEVVEADYGAGAGGLVGSDTAERDNIPDSAIFRGGGDGLADSLRIRESVVAGGVGWNHDVGGVRLLKGLGEGSRVGDIGD